MNSAEPSRPRIVVADGHSANPGDLDWSPLAELGALAVFPRSGPRLVEHCRDAEVVLTNKERFPREVFEALPRLRFVSVLATGTNVIDLDAARDHGVAVSNVPGYSTRSVAQHTFALLLEFEHRVSAHAAAASSGEWSRGPDFSHRLVPIHELAERTLGIVGMGAIGRTVARIAHALGMRVLAARRSAHPAPELLGVPVEWLDLDALFEQADVVTLHCPLTPETRSLVNAARLARMRQTAILINTGRGDLIDEAALDAALRSGRIRGALLDVLQQEPPPADHPLLSAPNCWITPHLAWASVEARQRLLAVSAENVRAFFRGAPVNVVVGLPAKATP